MSGKSKLSSWPVLLSVWISLLVYGAVAAPVPGVNEPHYLCKARHFWQPDWCSQDFFLVSPNAHVVFFATIGSLTSIVSFEQSAWLGRVVAMLVLAWGWVHAFSQIFLTRWASLWGCWLFLALTACGNFSGEWLVGGVEGKVLSYGLLLVAFADVLRFRWIRAAIWAGMAVSFHPVVGIWGVLAFSISQLIGWIRRHRQTRRTSLIRDYVQTQVGNVTPTDAGALKRDLPRTVHSAEMHAQGDQAISRSVQGASNDVPFAKVALLYAVVLILALPGLIPVVMLLLEPVPAETSYAGTYIQVYFRLAHHLDPMMFPARAYAGYFLLLTIWFASFWWGGQTRSKKQFDQVVIWSVVFALMGILIGLGPRPPERMPWFDFRMNLLKFYPFRLADLLVPVAVAVSLVSVFERTSLGFARVAPGQYRPTLSHACMLLVFLAALCRAHATTESNRYATEDRKDWLDICRWIDAHLPHDAIVQSPTNGWAFKWFAQRAEYVAFKDCPQDAAGIVEWNRRLTFLQRWYETNYADSFYSANELRDLRRQTGMTHLLTDRLGPLELEPIYRNGTFQVYDLGQLDDAKAGR